LFLRPEPGQIVQIGDALIHTRALHGAGDAALQPRIEVVVEASRDVPVGPVRDDRGERVMVPKDAAGFVGFSDTSGHRLGPRGTA
jgi:hypothetical protein